MIKSPKAIIASVMLILAPCIFNCSFATHTITGNRSTSSDYRKLCNEFHRIGAWGLHTTIDLTSCDPELIRSKEAIKAYVYELCQLIDMKRFGPTVIVHFGQDERVAGYSMYQLIETSNISGHFANETNAAYIDIFSCKLYDPEIVRHFTANFFNGTIHNSTVIFRT